MSKRVRSALLGAAIAGVLAAPLVAMPPALAGGAPPTGQFLRHALSSTAVQAGGRFGTVIARSGNLMAVGQPGNADGSQAGKVFVYQRTGVAWSKTKLLAALSDTAGGNGTLFGTAVAFIGNSIAVGAPYATVGGLAFAGAVEVYTRPVHGWANMSTPTAVLTPSDLAAADEVGGALAAIGSSLVAGAVGDEVSGHIGQGAAYVFTKPANGWTTGHQTAELTSSNGASQDNFGFSVAATSTYVVISSPVHHDAAAPGAGRLYVFVPGSGWEDSTETRVLADNFSTDGSQLGYSIATNGQIIVAGSPNQAVNGDLHQGMVSLFREPDNGWGTASTTPFSQLAVLTVGDGQDDDAFGTAVSVSGNVVVVGAPSRTIRGKVGAGATYVFDNPSGRWSNETPDAQLLAPTLSPLGLFGNAVTNVGTNIVVGESNSGATTTRPGTGQVGLYRPLPNPVISHLKQSAKVWRLGRSTRALNWYKRVVGGDKFSFDLNAPAMVTLTFTKINNGADQVVGATTQTGTEGANALFFHGQLTPSKTIKPGHYKVTFTATTAAGVTSAPKSLLFTAKPEASSH